MRQRYVAPVTGLTKEPYKTVNRQIFDRVGREKFEVYVVSDEDNAMDPNALRIMVHRALGPECAGYLANRRSCPECSNEQNYRGPAAYDTPTAKAPSRCPVCDAKLIKGCCEQLAPKLRAGAKLITAQAWYVGAQEGKANLGLMCELEIETPNE